MFDDAHGMLQRHSAVFRGSVRDSFGASIETDVLYPLCREIELLRSMHDEFLRQSLCIGQVLTEARSMTCV